MTSKAEIYKTELKDLVHELFVKCRELNMPLVVAIQGDTDADGKIDTYASVTVSKEMSHKLAIPIELMTRMLLEDGFPEKLYLALRAVEEFNKLNPEVENLESWEPTDGEKKNAN